MYMKEINIAKIIHSKRKEFRLTQDDIAGYIGVSKASVSKWETGQSYPDITFLPQLATLFHISIDELMGYQPQMTREEIREVYRQLSKNFAEQPFEEVMEQCRAVIREYYACFPLLFLMGTLLVNHSMLAGDAGKVQEILKEARELFVRVRTESCDVELARESRNMEAVCLLSLGQPDEVVEMIDGTELLLMSQEALLSLAYRMTGRMQEANSVCQVGIYQYLSALLNLLVHYQELCVEDRALFDETHRRITALAETFRMGELHPALLFPYYISAAQGYMTLGDTGKACTYLEQYTELVMKIEWPLKLHGDAYFDTVDDWLENRMILGEDMPRDGKLVRRSMVEAVAENPAFAALHEEAAFQRILEKLKGRYKESDDTVFGKEMEESGCMQ